MMIALAFVVGFALGAVVFAKMSVGALVCLRDGGSTYVGPGIRRLAALGAAAHAACVMRDRATAEAVLRQAATGAPSE